MKILHTSDWHIGRSFHGNSTIDFLRTVLEALVNRVEEYRVDIVVVSGDIFDSATPAAENYDVLTETITKIRAVGARVMLTSGNHDSATRLGFNAGFTSFSGVHIHTRPELSHEPVTIQDQHGPVHFYGIPYLEPSLVRQHFAGTPGEDLRSHEQVLRATMNRIREDLNVRGGRSVVLSHAFIADIPVAQIPFETVGSRDTAIVGLERDITSGGLDLVPLGVFDGPDYVALGHIHGRATLSTRVRYSGAPLHYSFGEAGKPRGAWLVELGSAGLDGVEWIELPVPRRLTVLTGVLDDLIADPANGEFENDWISAVLTDRVRPMDAMRRLQKRFRFAAQVEHRPEVDTSASVTTYGARLADQNDHEIVEGFLELVRNGVGASGAERLLIARAISDAAAGAQDHSSAPVR